MCVKYGADMSCRPCFIYTLTQTPAIHLIFSDMVLDDWRWVHLLFVIVLLVINAPFNILQCAVPLYECTFDAWRHFYSSVLHNRLLNVLTSCKCISSTSMISMKDPYQFSVLSYDVETHESLITKTYLYNFDLLKPHFYIVKLGFTGVNIIFHISAQNINCGYSLEPPRRGGSNGYPQSMFWAEMW